MKFQLAGEIALNGNLFVGVKTPEISSTNSIVNYINVFLYYSF